MWMAHDCAHERMRQHKQHKYDDNSGPAGQDTYASTSEFDASTKTPIGTIIESNEDREKHHQVFIRQGRFAKATSSAGG